MTQLILAWFIVGIPLGIVAALLLWIAWLICLKIWEHCDRSLSTLGFSVFVIVLLVGGGMAFNWAATYLISRYGTAEVSGSPRSTLHAPR